MVQFFFFPLVAFLGYLLYITLIVFNFFFFLVFLCVVKYNCFFNFFLAFCFLLSLFFFKLKLFFFSLAAFPGYLLYITLIVFTFLFSMFLCVVKYFFFIKGKIKRKNNHFIFFKRRFANEIVHWVCWVSGGQTHQSMNRYLNANLNID